MPRISENTKRDRLERVDRLLQRSEGLTEDEIAQTLNFERRTTNNYLRELEVIGKACKEGPLWFSLSFRTPVLRKFELQPEEAMILYLASRLFVKQSDQRNEVAESALLKLADSLSSDMGLGDGIFQAAKDLAQRPRIPGYEDVFRTVMRSYIYRRKVELAYHPYRGKPFITIFSPYLLEPSAIGFATYAIGHSSTVDGLRTYKLGRIEQARLLPKAEYAIPTDFAGFDLLRNAWSIYYGEETIQVVLRFHPDVTKRVQETNWHPSQQSSWDKEKQDFLLVSFEVADTTDLKPWIRTWGANCEVVAPTELRDEMMGEARKLAELYGWHTHRGAINGSEDDPLGLGQTFGDFFG
jgi:predicted DNA-binding transcriptional regulator YafY